MKLQDLKIGVSYFDKETNSTAIYRGVNSLNQPIFELPIADPQKGVELQFDQPETALASGLYWCYEGLENAFTEIETKTAES